MTKNSLKHIKFAVFLVAISTQFLFTFEKSENSIFADRLISRAEEFSKNNQFDSSNYYYNEAVNFSFQNGEWANYLLAHRGLSKNYIKSRNLDEALSLLGRADAVISEKCGDLCTERGSNYALMGYIYTLKGEYSSAVGFIAKAIDLDSTVFGKDHEKVASDYYALGITLKSMGKFDGAIESLNKAKKIQEDKFGNYSSVLSNTMTNLGSVYDEENQFTKAVSCYKQSLDILSRLGEDKTSDAATCRVYLMSSLNNIGDIGGAIEQGNTAIQIYQDISLPQHPNMASAYGKLGEIYISIGDFDKAKEYLEQSLHIFTERYPEKKSAIGTLYQLLSEVHKQTGDFSAALRYSLQGIRHLEESSDSLHPQMGFMYELTAGVYAELHQYDKALQFYQKAIASRERVAETASRNDIASIYTSIASLRIVQKEYALAEKFLKKAEVIQARSEEKNPLQFAETQKQLGNLFVSRHQFARAFTAYDAALSILCENVSLNDRNAASEMEKSIYKRELLEISALQAKTFELSYKKTHNINDLKSALLHYQYAMTMIDEVRRQFGSEGSKFHLAEQSKSIYGNACRISLDLLKKTGSREYEETAFQIADRSKANILLEKLFDGKAKSFAGIPDSLLKQEKELLKTVAFLETQLFKNDIQKGADVSDSHKALQSQLFLVKRKHQELIALFEHQYPKYYQLKYSGYSLDVRDAQNRMPAGTGLVEYLVADDGAYVFFLSKDTLAVRTISSSSKIENAVVRFTASLKKYETREYVSSGYDLYASLIQPIRSFIRTDSKIVIIPDGELYYLPFEALPTQRYRPNSLPDFTAIDYFIKQNEISYSYSAEFYLNMRDGASADNSASSFIGFAPVFRDSTHNGDLLANRSYVDESGLSDVRSITLDGKKFNELKYSEEEVGSITQSFRRHALPAKEYLHTAATESNFKEFSKSYDIVHVATHGFINEKNPKFSAILFSQPSSTTADDDGILYVDETFNLDLHAKLVVLSSCESGLGKLVQGEGMIALTRGLFYAGAKNIMFSLWKVSDKQTYLLMDEFYKQMLNGKSYSASLREAKLRLISSKESAFPSKWSGFVLVGE